MFKIIIGRLLYSTLGNLFSSDIPIIGRMIGRPIRNFCAYLILSKCGKNITIEDHSIFSSRIELGNNSGIGKNCFIQGKTIIGNDVMMSPGVKIYSINHNFSDLNNPMNKQGSQKEKPIYIGNDVWIGCNVILLPGVKIGNGVILGTGSVVRKNIPDYAIVYGNPAEIIDFRRRDYKKYGEKKNLDYK